MHTLRVTREYKDADRVELLNPDGSVANVLDVNHYDGKITYAQDWPALLEYKDEVRRVFHPGHGDPCAQYEEYFLV